MKIAYVTSIFPFASGEAFFKPEVRSLAAHDEVIVIPLRPRQKNSAFPGLGASELYMGLFDAHVARLALAECARQPAKVLAALRAVFGPRYSLRSKLVNAAVVPKGLALAAEVRRLGVEHIHAQWMTSPSTAAYIASMLTGVPWSITAHQHDIFFDNLTSEKVAHARFTRVISARNCRHLQERVWPSAAMRCKVVHLGVDVPARTVAGPERAVRILCAARMCIWKGHRFLLAALRELRARGVAFTCDLAGDGELHAQIAQLIVDYGLSDCVRMVGVVHHDALTEQLAAGEYDVVALASTEQPGEHEGISVAVMEAMAAGVPVVATRTGSLDELVLEGTGYLVPQRDPLAMAAAIEILARDRELRLRVGLRGRARVSESFETSATTAELRALIYGAPASRPAPHDEVAALVGH